MTRLEAWQKKYGKSGIALSLLVNRYIEKTSDADPAMAERIVGIVRELCDALNQ